MYPPYRFVGRVEATGAGGLCFCPMALTNFYIDGFNLYYRALRGTPYKWLDLFKLCQSLMPSHQVGQIRYFTTIIQVRPPDLQAAQRQATYIRALETIPNLSVH